jgi:hypothetical protein
MMAKPVNQGAPVTTRTLPLAPELVDLVEVTADDFRESFGEDLQRTLDVDTWLPGDLGEEYSRIEREVREAVEQEDELQRRIRADVFPLLKTRLKAPKNAGVYGPVEVPLVKEIHRGLLFNGGVEACDGTHQVHDTLPLTIHQIGVSLVSYCGDQGTWCQRLFRRDLRVRGGDPVDELTEILSRRDRRGGLNQTSRRDSMSEMVRRAIMAYAERAILLDKSTATWRMGHGNPAPWELMTGAGSLDLMIEAVKVLRRLIENHQRFVFVASEPSERMLLSIGQALRPTEYAIVRTLDESLEKMVEHGNYRIDRRKLKVDTSWDGRDLSPMEWIRRFRDQIATQVVVGVYRATHMAPAQVFYAHVEHAHIAAHIAIADSALQEHRGFPLLIDLADNVCASVFGEGHLNGLLATAYSDAGAPWRYLSERTTRGR